VITKAPLDAFCGHCGGDRKGEQHDRCDQAASLEPPRYCVACRRRMVVQVIPTGWSARCSRHGEVTSDRP
jgi:hypothetical protein